MPDTPGAHLRRDIKFLGAALLVLNGLIGSGIFALPGKVAVTAGLMSPWLFLIIGFMTFMIGLVADLISFNRRLLEMTLERVKLIEFRQSEDARSREGT